MYLFSSLSPGILIDDIINLTIYLLLALFIDISSDIYLTVHFRDRGKYPVAAIATVSLYFFTAYFWTVYLGKTAAAFSGQGAIGLGVILVGLVFALLRAI